MRAATLAHPRFTSSAVALALGNSAIRSMFTYRSSREHRQPCQRHDTCSGEVLRCKSQCVVQFFGSCPQLLTATVRSHVSLKLTVQGAPKQMPSANLEELACCFVLEAHCAYNLPPFAYGPVARLAQQSMSRHNLALKHMARVPTRHDSALMCVTHVL